MAIAPPMTNDQMFDPMPSQLKPPPMAGNPVPMADAGVAAQAPVDEAQALPDTPRQASQTTEQPQLMKLDKTGLDQHAMQAEGQARHQAKLADFGAQKNAIAMQQSALSVDDPNFANKLQFLNAKHGQVKEAEAQYKLDHPWGSMESAHPGFMGKVGHAFGMIGNVAGEAVAPGLAEAIPGSQLNLQEAEQQGQAEQGRAMKGITEAAAANLTGQKAVTEAAKPALMGAQTEHTQAQTGLTEANTEKAQAQTGQIGEPVKADEQVLAAGTRIAQGVGTPKDAALVKSYHDLVTMKNDAKIAAHPNLKAEYEQAVKDGDHAKAQELLKIAGDYATATQPPQRPPQELVAVPNAQGGMTAEDIRPGSEIKSGTKSVKDVTTGASNDEKRRADLARNVNENLDQFEEILNRRPDLFGPVNGRITQMKMLAGSNDPDIGALKTIQEQTGMAFVGTHAMRNAQHVQTAANAVFNNFVNGPNAIRGSMKAARTSVATFQQDAGEEPGSAPKGGASTPKSKTSKKDSLGIL